MSFASSLIENPCDSPRAVLIKVSTTSREWSECEAVPAATFRAKFLATIVSTVAPQTPTRSFSSPFFERGSLGLRMREAAGTEAGKGRADGHGKAATPAVADLHRVPPEDAELTLQLLRPANKTAGCGRRNRVYNQTTASAIADNDEARMPAPGADQASTARPEPGGARAVRGRIPGRP